MEFKLPIDYERGNKISDYSNSLTLSNEDELFWSWIPKNHIQVQKVKENFVVVVYVLHKTLNKVFPHRSNEKVCCPCRVVVLLIKPEARPRSNNSHETAAGNQLVEPLSGGGG